MVKPLSSLLAALYPKAASLIGLGLISALSLSCAQADGYDFQTHSEMSDFVRQDCGACHGLSLKGGLGRPLLKENLDHFDLETLEEIILDGIPDTAMPPWRGLLSQEQAKDIAKALKEGSIQ